jgi:hypothetical protein
MSCLAWGYANRVAPLFLPDTGGNQVIPQSLNVGGNAVVEGGYVVVGNNGFQGNAQGAYLKLSPVTLTAQTKKPPAYAFQVTPDKKLNFFREYIPSPATTSNSTIMQVQPSETRGSIANIMTLNAQVNVQSAVISPTIVSGLAGMRYTSGTLAPNNPTFKFLGATLFLKSYPSANAGCYIRLPSDIQTNDRYDGVTVFKFVFAQSTTNQALAITSSTGTFLTQLMPDPKTITEAIWANNALTFFSYPYVPVPSSQPGVSELPPPTLDAEYVEDLPLAKLSEPIV